MVGGIIGFVCLTCRRCGVFNNRLADVRFSHFTFVTRHRVSGAALGHYGRLARLPRDVGEYAFRLVRCLTGGGGGNTAVPVSDFSGSKCSTACIRPGATRGRVCDVVRACLSDRNGLLCYKIRWYKVGPWHSAVGFIVSAIGCVNVNVQFRVTFSGAWAGGRCQIVLGGSMAGRLWRCRGGMVSCLTLVKFHFRAVCGFGV